MDRIPGWLTTKQYAEKHDKTTQAVCRLLRINRLPGAIKVQGAMWMIPEDTPWPAQVRRLSELRLWLEAGQTDEAYTISAGTYRFPSEAAHQIARKAGARIATRTMPSGDVKVFLLTPASPAG